MGFALLNRFLGHSQVVTTNNYITLQFTVTTVFNVCLLVAAWERILSG
jgi:hypothetical protein